MSNEPNGEGFAKFIADHKKAKPGSIFYLNDTDVVDVEVIPTGVISLDVALGVGGLPRGRIVELYGPEQSGKSSLALTVCAQAQKLGGFVGYIDAEHALSPHWAENAFGVDPSRCAIAQPDDGNEALNMVVEMCRSNAFDVIVVDSVAALVPSKIAESEIGEANQLGLHAKMMSDGLRKLTPVIAKSKAVVVFINQIRMNPNAYGNPEIRTGGKSLGYYASVVIEVRSSASKRISVGGVAVGQECVVKIKKNKVAAPHREASYELYYDSGISAEAALLDVGLETGALTRTGNTIVEAESGEKIGVGREKAKEHLKANPDIAKRVTAAIYAKLTWDGTDDNEPQDDAATDSGMSGSVTVDSSVDQLLEELSS